MLVMVESLMYCKVGCPLVWRESSLDLGMGMLQEVFL